MHEVEFAGLTPGSYEVHFLAPTGEQFTVTGGDSAADPATGFTQPLSVSAGELTGGVDAGLYEPVSLGGLLWYDANGNGSQDTGEPGLPRPLTAGGTRPVRYV